MYRMYEALNIRYKSHQFADDNTDSRLMIAVDVNTILKMVGYRTCEYCDLLFLLLFLHIQSKTVAELLLFVIRTKI